MATIEFKNPETQQFFSEIVYQEYLETLAFQTKCARVLKLQKAGLCSQPIEEVS